MDRGKESIYGLGLRRNCLCFCLPWIRRNRPTFNFPTVSALRLVWNGMLIQNYAGNLVICPCSHGINLERAPEVQDKACTMRSDPGALLG